MCYSKKLHFMWALILECLVQNTVQYQIQMSRAYEIWGIQVSGLCWISFVSLFGFHETLNLEKPLEFFGGFYSVFSLFWRESFQEAETREKGRTELLSENQGGRAHLHPLAVRRPYWKWPSRRSLGFPGAEALNVLSQAASLRQWGPASISAFNCKVVREWAVRISQRREFQAEGTAGTEALGWVYVWPVHGRTRSPMWLGWLSRWQ